MKDKLDSIFNWIETLKEYIETSWGKPKNKQWKEATKKRYFFVLKYFADKFPRSIIHRSIKWNYESIMNSYKNYMLETNYLLINRNNTNEEVDLFYLHNPYITEEEEKKMEKKLSNKEKKRINQEKIIIQNFLDYIMKRTWTDFKFPRVKLYKIKKNIRESKWAINTQVVHIFLKYLKVKCIEKEKIYKEYTGYQTKEKLKKMLKYQEKLKKQRKVEKNILVEKEIRDITKIKWLSAYQRYIIVLLLSIWEFNVEEIRNLKWKDIVAEIELVSNKWNQYEKYVYSGSSYIRRPIFVPNKNYTRKERKEQIDKLKESNLEYHITNKWKRKIITELQAFRHIKRGKSQADNNRKAKYIISPIISNHSKEKEHLENKQISVVYINKVIKETYQELKKIKEKYLKWDNNTINFIKQNNLKNIIKLPHLHPITTFNFVYERKKKEKIQKKR